jgi:1-deoxy-D-xylulose-5-phosphate reductoisomerase
MSDIVEHCLAKMDYIGKPAYEDYVNTDKLTRVRAMEMVGSPRSTVHGPR